MKKCRDNSAQLEQVKAQNAELQHSLTEKTAAHEKLQEEMTDVRGTYDELVQQLKDDIANGQVSIKQSEKGLTVTMGNQILFRSGKAVLQPHGKKVLLQVAGVIKKSTDKLIQVEGYTDNQRISGALKAQFPSNWELSATRSASVVRFLQESGGIDPSLLVLTAYAENNPIGDNSTREGRAQNRRVEITLVPK